MAILIIIALLFLGMVLVFKSHHGRNNNGPSGDSCGGSWFGDSSGGDGGGDGGD